MAMATPLARAKAKHGTAGWASLSARERMAAVEAARLEALPASPLARRISDQEDQRSPDGKTSTAQSRLGLAGGSPVGAVAGGDEAGTGGSAAVGSAMQRVGGSMADLSALVGSFGAACNAAGASQPPPLPLQGGERQVERVYGAFAMSGDLTRLQAALVATLRVVEDNLVDLHSQTKRHLQLLAAEKAELAHGRDAEASAHRTTAERAEAAEEWAAELAGELALLRGRVVSRPPPRDHGGSLAEPPPLDEDGDGCAAPVPVSAPIPKPVAAPGTGVAGERVGAARVSKQKRYRELMRKILAGEATERDNYEAEKIAEEIGDEALEVQSPSPRPARGGAASPPLPPPPRSSSTTTPNTLMLAAASPLGRALRVGGGGGGQLLDSPRRRLEVAQRELGLARQEIAALRGDGDAAADNAFALFQELEAAEQVPPQRLFDPPHPTAF
jgi:hypothetical protein